MTIGTGSLTHGLRVDLRGVLAWTTLAAGALVLLVCVVRTRESARVDSRIAVVVEAQKMRQSLPPTLRTAQVAGDVAGDGVQVPAKSAIGAIAEARGPQAQEDVLRGIPRLGLVTQDGPAVAA